jgi:hypothetical protein
VKAHDTPHVNAEKRAALRANVEASLIEVFRKAPMVEHHQDWDMDTISEAAHICAEAWCDRYGSAHSDGSRYA